MLLTIGMMVKNEEKHLEECLEALNPIREQLDSELVVVDTGSNDNTVEIAKQFTDKLYFHEWNDNFAEMRNVVINHSKGEWFFSLDADEIIENAEPIINFFQSGKHKNYKTALITIKNLLDLNGKYTKVSSARLFENNSDFKYTGAIHEQPNILKPVIKLDTILKHFGYLQTDKEFIEKKYQRTKRLLLKELEKNPDNIYYLFQLSQTYGLHGDNDKALNPIIKAYNIGLEDNKINFKYRMYILIQLAMQYFLNNYYERCINICNKAIEINDGYLDIYFYLAKSQKKLNLNEKAIKNYKIYLDINNDFEKSIGKNDISVDNKTLSYIDEVYVDLINLYFENNQYVKIIEYGRKIKKPNQFVKISNHILNAFSELKELNKIFDFYDSANNEEIRNILINKIEEKIINNFFTKEDVNIIFSKFSKLNNTYGLLNRVRDSIYNNKNLSESGFEFKELDGLSIENLPNYYADILYFLLINNLGVKSILLNINEEKLINFMNYLNEKYVDLDITIYEYLNDDNLNINDLQKMKSYFVLLRYIFANNNLNEFQLKEMLFLYINIGDEYLRKTYSNLVITEELIKVLNKEETFLLYMTKAKKIKDMDSKKYIKYLRKSLEIYPLMEKGIKLLLEEFKNRSKKENELEKYKAETKEKIEILIDNQKIDKAKKIIYKYEGLISNDPDIKSMKSVIYIMEGNLSKAKHILKKAIKIHKNNFDLFYNLAYVYQQLEEYKNSYKIGKKALIYANTDQEKNDINKLLMKLDTSIDEKINLIKKDKPIFIGGAGRSGTTLLRVMLNAHSNLASGPEFKILPNISNIYKQLQGMEDIRKSYSLTEDEFINDIFKKFISNLFENFIVNNDAIRLVEKTPHNILVMEELGSIFPEAKFIHMIRDGRDVVSSLLTKNWVGFDGKPLSYVENIEDAAKYWKNTVIKGINDGNNNLLKDRVKIIKYENLIEHTKEEIRKILEFIEEPWDKKVLEYYEVDRGYEPQESSTKQVNKKINKKSLNRWKNDFNKKDKKIFKKVAGDLLIDLGYEKDNNW